MSTRLAITVWVGAFAVLGGCSQSATIDVQFRTEFCAKVPKGDVSGWIGNVDSISDHTPDKGIRLKLGRELINLMG